MLSGGVQGGPPPGEKSCFYAPKPINLGPEKHPPDNFGDSRISRARTPPAATPKSRRARGADAASPPPLRFPLDSACFHVRVGALALCCQNVVANSRFWLWLYITQDAHSTRNATHTHRHTHARARAHTHTHTRTHARTHVYTPAQTQHTHTTTAVKPFFVEDEPKVAARKSTAASK